MKQLVMSTEQRRLQAARHSTRPLWTLLGHLPDYPPCASPWLNPYGQEERSGLSGQPNPAMYMFIKAPSPLSLLLSSASISLPASWKTKVEVFVFCCVLRVTVGMVWLVIVANVYKSCTALNFIAVLISS